jgi:hypothetical protein
VLPQPNTTVYWSVGKDFFYLIPMPWRVKLFSNCIKNIVTNMLVWLAK